MLLARILRRRGVSTEVVRFIVGGGVNTLLSYAIYWLLLLWLSYPYAYTVSYAAAILTGFAINTHFVFRTEWSWRKLAAFPLIQLLNYGLGLGTVTVSVKYLGIDARLAPIVATAVVLPITFVLTRTLMRHRF